MRDMMMMMRKIRRKGRRSYIIEKEKWSEEKWCGRTR
jgi:hypothetical protein